MIKLFKRDHRGETFLQIYSYSIPELDSYYTSIPIYNKDNKVISILKKNCHRILTQLFHGPTAIMLFQIDNHPIQN